MEIFCKQSRLAKTRGAVRDSLHTDTLLIVTWILTGIFQSGKSVLFCCFVYCFVTSHSGLKGKRGKPLFISCYHDSN